MNACWLLVTLASISKFLKIIRFDNFRIFLWFDHMLLYTVLSKFNHFTFPEMYSDLESWNIISWFYPIFSLVPEAVICLDLNLYYFNGTQPSYFHLKYVWLQFPLKLKKNILQISIFNWVLDIIGYIQYNWQKGKKNALIFLNYSYDSLA